MRPTTQISRTDQASVPRVLANPLRLLTGLAVLIHSATSMAVNSERGRLLYENQCQACHTRMLHTPEIRKLNNHRLKPVGSSYGLKVRIRVG